MKPADSEIEAVIEWDGCEGTLYDVIWKDGDIWTLPGGMGASLKRITNVLKECGFGEVPTRKNWRVFRPEPEEKKNFEQSGPANPCPSGTSSPAPAKSASRAGSGPEASRDT